MIKKFMKRYRRWEKWASWHLGGPVYKILVLLGIEKSPTFEMGPNIEHILSDWQYKHGDIREGRL